MSLSASALSWGVWKLGLESPHGLFACRPGNEYWLSAGPWSGLLARAPTLLVAWATSLPRGG